MEKIRPTLLWIATALNLYLSIKGVCGNVRECRGTNSAQGNLHIAVIILFVSLPIAVDLLSILVAGWVKRFSESEGAQVIGSKFSMLLASLNILAPGVLLSASNISINSDGYAVRYLSRWTTR